MDCDGPGTVLVFTWRLDRPGPDGKAVSNFFQYQNEDVFRAGIARKLGPHPPQQYICSTWWQQISINLPSVSTLLRIFDTATPMRETHLHTVGIFMTDEGDHAVRRWLV